VDGWGEEVRGLRGDSSVVCVGFPMRLCGVGRGGWSADNGHVHVHIT
jgi:hypothetical protein